jgi:SAM-dependent methyltransferase
MSASPADGPHRGSLRSAVDPYLRRLLSRPAGTGVFARPRIVTDPRDCYFYHTMDIPGHGLVEGQWDLRDGVAEYTGGIDYQGRRVLEIGTASGFVCFAMERMGAEVVAFDLSDDQSWDIVPMHGRDDLDVVIAERRAVMRQINDGYWFAHRALGSRAQVVYGTVYEIPSEIGTVDVSTWFSVLLHLRDPFLALQNGLRLTRETVVVTELRNPHRRGLAPTPEAAPWLPRMEFVPDFHGGGPVDTWWYLGPEVIQAFLGVLGFGDSRVINHVQKARWGQEDLFTVVANRTAGQPVVA